MADDDVTLMGACQRKVQDATVKRNASLHTARMLPTLALSKKERVNFFPLPLIVHARFRWLPSVALRGVRSDSPRSLRRPQAIGARANAGLHGEARATALL